MIRNLIRWVVPGLATVVCGTTLCVAMTSAGITSNLATETQSAMQAGGFDWAELSLDMRDVRLSGTTTDTARLQAAVARLQSIDGVRSVSSDVTLAPMATPYLLTAAVTSEGTSLSGAVPDETTRQNLLRRAGLATGSLALRSGMPDRLAWTAGAQFAIDNLHYLDQGSISISDSAISLVGRARSERDYRDLLIVMRAGPPAGLRMDTTQIIPALVEPYQWSATSDGKRIDVTGFVPDDASAERLRTADVAGLPVATGLALGSGEPSNFATLSQTLLEQLAKLEYGAVSIDGDTSTLTGAPPTLEIAQSVAQTLESSGSIVVLEPPRVPDYWMSATRQVGGLVVFDGYAPDEATRAALGQRSGADIQWLKLGRGAPERYQSAVDFGLAALDLMSDGRFALRDNVLTLSGTAASSADYATLRDTLGQGAPQGLVLARAEIVAPRAEPYGWQASKDAAGVVTLSGVVPSPEAEAALLALAGADATAALTYGSGEPNTFMAMAETAIGLMARLQTGAVVYDGAGWTITGTPSSAADQAALEADFAGKSLAAAGWSMAIAAPAVAVAPPQPAVAAAAAPEPAAAVVEPAAVEPYLWSVSKAQDGAVTASGNVPATAFQRVAAVRVGAGFVDETVVSPGAPEGFVDDALAGLAALSGLSEGTARFDGAVWSVDGTLIDASGSDLVGNAITSGATPPDEWRIDLAEAPVVAPEPEPVAERPTPAPAVEAQAPVEPPATAQAAPAEETTPIQEAPPVEVAAPAPEPAATPSATEAADLAACAAPIAQFSARNAIFFQSGAAGIASDSNAALDELAIDLAACPSATVHIEGHTDADGDDALNMALSVSRAEAVVAALVARGVAADRLYAVGYGESAPIADNATAQGKRMNRRIVVTVKAGH